MKAYKASRPGSDDCVQANPSQVEYGYLLPQTGSTVTGRYGTRLIAAVHARSASRDYVLMRTSPQGWRTLDGLHTPDELANSRNQLQARAG